MKRSFSIFMFNCLAFVMSSIALAVTSEVVNKDKTFNIISKFLVDGKLISSPSLVVHTDHPSSMNISNNYFQNLHMTVIAKDIQIPTIQESVQVSFDIQYRNGNNNVHLKPQFILMLNQEGRMKLSNSGHLYEIMVVAKNK